MKEISEAGKKRQEKFLADKSGADGGKKIISRRGTDDFVRSTKMKAIQNSLKSKDDLEREKFAGLVSKGLAEIQSQSKKPDDSSADKPEKSS